MDGEGDGGGKGRRASAGAVTSVSVAAAVETPFTASMGGGSGDGKERCSTSAEATAAVPPREHSRGADMDGRGKYGGETRGASPWTTADVGVTIATAEGLLRGSGMDEGGNDGAKGRSVSAGQRLLFLSLLPMRRLVSRQA